MKEENATPYPQRTEDICDVVCEPTTDYGKTIAYQGTTIANALKDYYTFPMNREKVDVLKWIVAQPDFTELQRFSTAEYKIYTLYTNQYDEILKTGEIPNNLQIAQKFVANGYDVFLLSNPKATKSADFIICKRNCLYYVEGKTSTGGSSIEHRFEKGATQADRIVVNFIGVPQTSKITDLTQKVFFSNTTLTELIFFKGRRMIVITRTDCIAKDFAKRFKRIWNSKK
ncbi:MAG: hypothetical protein IK117_03110 [Bacteroidales bacterium]|nr:hypothetical protein [Bacteroidales bacterium]